MESNPIRMCELLGGLPAVTVLGVVSRDDEPLRVHVERVEAFAGCPDDRPGWPGTSDDFAVPNPRVLTARGLNRTR